MRKRVRAFLVPTVIAAAAIGFLIARDNRATGQKQGAAGDGDGRPADREAIEKSARAFMKAFEQGDAAQVASLWTEQGEMHEPGGEVIQGRANIEKSFREHFKHNPKAKMDVLIENIRFPGPNLAIEEGVLRHTGAGKELPSTTLYSVTHVKDGGQWKVAVSREWGAGQDRLEDLAWLVGKWKAAVGDQEVTLLIAKEAKKPSLVGRFTKKAQGKDVFSGTMKIFIDTARGQLRSWHFDDEGGHGQALWIRDGNRWVLDSIAVLPDGTETASVNILGRINNDELTWRSIDRVMGNEELPDTVPIRLVRVKD
ncbi:MAG: nuclear transport factor 2 family protein [Planctomycetes bacterium]|nr:nuclear transport factor 2 family protein [Planctomycetota bacterium]